MSCIEQKQPNHPTLDPNLCTVAHYCGANGTGVAIWVHDKQQCWVLCQGNGSIANVDAPRLGLDTPVSVEAKAVERAKLAEFMANICAFEIFIPAVLASEKITLTIQKTTLGEFIDHAGLLAVRP